MSKLTSPLTLPLEQQNNPMWLNVTLFIFGAILVLAYPATMLSYIGTTLDKDGQIHSDDKRRKFLIFFSWFFIVLSSISTVYSVHKMNTGTVTAKDVFFFVQNLIWLVYHSFVLSYLGSSFKPATETIELKDWRRNVIVVFTWFSFVQGVIGLGASVL